MSSSGGVWGTARRILQPQPKSNLVHVRLNMTYGGNNFNYFPENQLTKLQRCRPTIMDNMISNEHEAYRIKDQSAYILHPSPQRPSSMRPIPQYLVYTLWSLLSTMQLSCSRFYMNVLEIKRTSENTSRQNTEV